MHDGADRIVEGCGFQRANDDELEERQSGKLHVAVRSITVFWRANEEELFKATYNYQGAAAYSYL